MVPFPKVYPNIDPQFIDPSSYGITGSIEDPYTSYSAILLVPGGGELEMPSTSETHISRDSPDKVVENLKTWYDRCPTLFKALGVLGTLAVAGICLTGISFVAAPALLHAFRGRHRFESTITAISTLTSATVIGTGTLIQGIISYKSPYQRSKEEMKTQKVQSETLRKQTETEIQSQTVRTFRYQLKGSLEETVFEAFNPPPAYEDI